MYRSLAFAAVFLTACVQSPPSGGGGGGTGVPTTNPVTLAGSYQLVALNDQPVQPGITLEIAGDNSFTGQAPCNRYFGSVAAQSDFSASFSQIGATRRACPALQLESAYLGALGTTTQYRPGREGDTLAFLDANGRTVASYVRAALPSSQANLDGRWTIEAVRANGTLTGVSGPGANISFSQATREFNANLGCNTATGPYTQSGNGLDFGAIAVTVRQCFAPAPFEGPILVALELVQSASQTSTGVDLLDANRQPVIRLTR